MNEMSLEEAKFYCGILNKKVHKFTKINKKREMEVKMREENKKNNILFAVEKADPIFEPLTNPIGVPV